MGKIFLNLLPEKKCSNYHKPIGYKKHSPIFGRIRKAFLFFKVNYVTKISLYGL